LAGLKAMLERFANQRAKHEEDLVERRRALSEAHAAMEIAECTFRPRFESKAPPLPLDFPRSFIGHVSRVRVALAEKERVKEAAARLVYTPESYERSRRLLELGPAPFAFEARPPQGGRRRPQMIIKVKMGAGRMGTIALCTGDDPGTMAEGFARVFSLCGERRGMLEGEIRARMRAYGIFQKEDVINLSMAVNEAGHSEES
jgi:hypothetical protein